MNNFAIDTKTISDALERSSSTARTFGIELDELVGMISAIGITTRESGSVVGNSLKTISSRITTMQPSIDALASIGINVKDSAGQMRSTYDILEELAGRWETLSAEQQQNMAVTLAGRFQLSRFLVLMQQWQTVTDVTTTSLNSQGSAMREQEEYSQSLEARLNRLANAGVELANSLGDAILTDSLIVFTETISDLANSSGDLIGTLGFLAPTLGLAGLAVGGFSKNTRDMTTAALFGSDAITQTSREALGLQAGMTAGASATRGLTMALRGLASATAIGAAFALIGFGLEKLINAYGDSIQKNEELRKSYEQTSESLRGEKENVDELISSYKELSNIGESSRNVEQEEEYVRVQNELAQLLPAIKIGEDAKGNAIVMNSDLIEDQIALIEEQIQLENELRAMTARGDIGYRREQIKQFESDIDKQKAKLTELHEEIEKITGSSKEDNFRRNLLMDDIDDVRAKLMELNGDMVSEISELSQDYSAFIQKFGADLEGSLSQVDISVLTNLATEAQMSDLMLQEVIIQASKLRDVMGQGFSLEGLSKEQIFEIGNIASAVRDGRFEWENYKSSLESVGMSSDQISQIFGYLRNSTEDIERAMSDLGYSGDNLIPTFNHLGDITGFVENETQALTDAFDENTDAMYENTDSKYSNIQASEILFGITGDQIKQAEQAIQIIQLLSSVENQSYEQKQMLAWSTEVLTQLFPHLSGEIAENIGFIQGEIIALKDLNDASAKGAINMMHNQDSLTRATVNASNQRINTYNNEASALLRIGDLINATAQKVSNFKTFSVGAGAGLGSVAKGLSGSLSLAGLSRNLSYAGAGLSSYSSSLQDVIYGSIISSDYKSSIPGSPRYSSGSSRSGSSKRPKSSSNSKASRGKTDAQLAREAEDAQKRVLDVIKQQIDLITRKAKLLDDDIAREEFYLAKVEETSQEYRDRQQNIAALQKRQANYYKQAEQYAARQLKSNKKLNAEQRRELEDTIVSMRRQYYSTLSSIDSINQKIKQSYESIADEVIQLYKDLYNQMRDIALKNVDDELSYLKKSHDERISMLDDELAKYEEIVRYKLDMLDQEEDNDDFERKLAERQKERTELQRQIDILSMDDSMEARRKASELREQLAEADSEYEIFMTERSRELQRRALEQNLEDKRTEIEEKKVIEDEAFQREEERLNLERERIQQHYENLLNDERNFARMRQNILAGNTKSMLNELGKFGSQVKSNMSTIGQSISNNLIDRISAAQKQLNSITKSYNQAKTATSTSKSSSSSKSSAKSSSSSKSTAKPVRVGSKVKVNKSNASAYMDAYGSQVRPWSAQAKAAGVSYSQGLYAVNERNGYVALGKTKSVGSAIAWVKKNDLVGLATGGYTGNQEGVAMLHKKELVLNAKDTDNMLSMVNLTRDLVKDVKSPTINNQSNNSGGNIFNLNIDASGSTSSPQDIFKTMVDNLKNAGVQFT